MLKAGYCFYTPFVQNYCVGIWVHKFPRIIDAHRGGKSKPSKMFAKLVNKNAKTFQKGVTSSQHLKNP